MSDASGSDPGEQTLDPADWGSFRQTAHRMLDACLDLVQHVRQGPVWRPVPDTVKQALAADVPLEGESLEQICQDLQTLVLPYATGNIHPRFFGWVHGTGTPSGIIAEMCAAAMNSNCGGRDHGAIYVERQVIDWCRTIFGFPAGASGVLTSGTSEGTLITLAAARLKALGPASRGTGINGAAQLTLYCSAEAHNATSKAADLLGIGADAVRKIRTDGDHAIDVDALRESIIRDRTLGLTPFCVVGSAGTVNSGGFDDHDALADVCRDEGLWLHIDGAFGAWARIADEPWRSLTKGIERADSIALDFHKWMHVQYDCGCVLMRDGAAHLAAFSARPDYLAAGEALAGGGPWFADYGIALSRSFRALKVWFTLREFGLRRLGSQVTMNCRQAGQMMALVESHQALEALAPVVLNICCFRYAPADVPEEQRDSLNAKIVAKLQEEGIVAFSTTRIGGKLAIRAAITNHRTRSEDMEIAVEAVIRAGAALTH